MRTNHRVIVADARERDLIAEGSADLVLTSPPYPMIQMWDDLFSRLNPEIKTALGADDGQTAFELMHAELDRVWWNAYAALRPGGWLIVNVGDATRSIADNFRLYSNHARILHACLRTGFHTLPNILWRKQTNAPNKFMGSGMLPAGAYVTLEHEYILVFRKEGKRTFKSPGDKLHRMQSALFWEERNSWYSDVWQDIKGARQNLVDDVSRARSAAFPLEFAHRLVSMFSLQGDVVLDPFAGTGTTMIAAMGSGRNSIGMEIDPHFANVMEQALIHDPSPANAVNRRRLEAHNEFVKARLAMGHGFKHVNVPYSFPVMTRQETELALTEIVAVSVEGTGNFSAQHRRCKDPSAQRIQKNSPVSFG